MSTNILKVRLIPTSDINNIPIIAAASFGATKPNSKSNADNHITHLPAAILTKPATIPKTTSTGIPLVTIFSPPMFNFFIYLVGF